MSELDTMISQAKQIDQLRAELQAERTEAIAAMKLGEALTQLETAQATIARQRDEISKFRTMFWHAENLLAVELCDKALAQPANQDALHEALAKESEECADIAGDLATKLWLADRAARPPCAKGREMMERLLISILVAVQIPFMFYLGGFDFTERSLLLAYCYFVTLFAYGVTYVGVPVWFPTLKSGKRNDHSD